VAATIKKERQGHPAAGKDRLCESSVANEKS